MTRFTDPTSPPVFGDEAPERNEVSTAIAGVAYELTHGLDDTPADLRDALAFAPLAAVKLVQQGAASLAKRPLVTLLSIAGCAAIIAMLARGGRK